ncbi:hypothetical protein VTJ49DRAFT_3243 [Mycothermus thermophilus]|uniref:Uncharacterized protein n=1 Tax=Humicola insolens TaxID=85995 RepID=A0ABR3V7Z1_HUMIN
MTASAPTARLPAWSTTSTPCLLSSASKLSQTASPPTRPACGPRISARATSRSTAALWIPMRLILAVPMTPRAAPLLLPRLPLTRLRTPRARPAPRVPPPPRLPSTSATALPWSLPVCSRLCCDGGNRAEPCGIPQSAAAYVRRTR